ncbi:ankyrin repeat domain-containing protein [Roseofilum sp. Belize Diploria]|uniref:ankyrin repeat domain-containing protein n=1 Tax=Roseofilum sp. Belize Diploria TaxID=2821501 RepID=UPI001B0AEECA|nr:ankyrin repeat domain-containing protein [Roseofilum sp. Belize Diploria]MBP0011246.1 ankyrin repeat domain-containing protein [Roseofilum sp. Belize Diploria]
MGFDSFWSALWGTNGYKEIHRCAKEGDSQWVKNYLERGGNPNVKAVGDVTPLYLAAQAGHLDVVRLLVEHGADVNQKASGMSLDCTPILVAMYRKHDEIVDFLLESGVEKDVYLAAGLGDLETLKALLQDEEDVNSIRNTDPSKPYLRGKSLLHLATSRDSVDMVEFLLEEKKGNVDIRDGDGYTPLHDAAGQNALTVAQLLIERGAAVDAPSQNSSTPLHRASACGRVKMIELLLDNGADINAIDGISRSTPLHKAIGTNRIEAVKILITRGASLKIKKSFGETPLAQAKDLGKREEIVKLLVAHGAE